MLGASGGRTAVVLAHHDHPGVVRRWVRELAGDDVSVLYLGGVPATARAHEGGPARLGIEDLTQLTDRLSRLGPLDVVVVTAPPDKLGPLGRDHYDLLPRLLFHLVPGGVLAVDRTLERGKRTPLAPDRWHRLLVGSRADQEAARLSASEVATSAATRSLLVSRQHVVVSKRDRHLLKLGEGRVDSVLADREPDLRVSRLVTLPPGSVESASAEHMYGESNLEPMPLRLDHPELTVRHYEGSLVSRGGTILHSASAILPESYRWPWDEALSHPHAPGIADDFVKAGRDPRRTLDGEFFYLDCVFSGHFGHILTEAVTRLWGWEHAKQHEPGLKALFHVRNEPGKDGGLERRLYSAYGIPSSDLVWSDHPVRLTSVVGATPMWQNHAPFYAHPGIRETWARLSAGLLSGREPARHERLFVSRGQDVQHRRGCRNQDEVERFFADRGFLVLYPEEHPLEEQVAMFAGARVVAGFAGSAMFNLMHARRLEAVVVLSHDAYVHRNEHMFARLHGAQLHHFWSPHDEVPESAGPRAQIRSSWAFDFPGLGGDLDRLTAEL